MTDELQNEKQRKAFHAQASALFPDWKFNINRFGQFDSCCIETCFRFWLAQLGEVARNGPNLDWHLEHLALMVNGNDGYICDIRSFPEEEKIDGADPYRTALSPKR